MEDGGGQDRVGVADAGPVDQMVEVPDTSRGDDRDRAAVRPPGRELEVEAVAGAVPVHRGEQDLAGSESPATARTRPPRRSRWPLARRG